MGPRNRREGSSGDDCWRRLTTANRPRVLLVDDEASIRTSVGRGLKALGYDIALTVDGKDGLEQLERWRPEVILMDLNLALDMVR